MTDETFIPTLIMHLRPETIPRVDKDYRLVTPHNDEEALSMDIYSVRYERMDEHAPSSTGWFPIEQRYEVPKSSGIEIPKPWGPYFLGVYDLANIRQSGALFIRKVATGVDHNLFLILPVERPRNIPPIAWPREVQLSPVPNWKKKLAAMKEQYLKEKQANEATNVEADTVVEEPADFQVEQEDAETYVTELEGSGGDDDDIGSYLPQELRPKVDGEEQSL